LKIGRTRKQINGPNNGLELLSEPGGAVATSRISENIFHSLNCRFLFIRIIQHLRIEMKPNGLRKNRKRETLDRLNKNKK